jgi:hypothetical protein
MSENCPHIVSSDEGTQYCALAEQTAGQLTALIAERDSLRQELAKAKEIEQVTGSVINVSSMLGLKDKKGWVCLRWNQNAGRLTPDEARQHALGVLEAAEAAQTDENMFQIALKVTKESPDDAHGIAIVLLRELRALRKTPIDVPPVPPIPPAQ